MMQAKERLYFTADKTELVGAGDARAASLYAAIGDEIPDSAAEKFGLVDGMRDVVILRVSASAGAFIEAAGFTFGKDFHGFVDGEIDIAQLLDILKREDLIVEAQLCDVDSPGFIAFPGREHAIEKLEKQVADDLANSRPHIRVGTGKGEEIEVSPALDAEPAKARAGAKEAKPGGDKEQKDAEDKNGDQAGDQDADAPADGNG